jgi:hypothetical protein
MNYIKNIFSNNKTDILDPLSVILKLFIYNYKPQGTKLSISFNKVIIQDIGIFQGSVRTFFGDSKNDINIIFGPVVYACIKYLAGSDREKYIYIFEIVSSSLNKLKLTYAGDEIVYTIDQIKNVIDSFITNKDHDISILVSNYNSNAFKIKQNIYDHINTVWTPERLTILYGFIHEIKNFVSHEYEYEIIYSLSTFLNCMDLNTKNIINNI